MVKALPAHAGAGVLKDGVLDTVDIVKEFGTRTCHRGHEGPKLNRTWRGSRRQIQGNGIGHEKNPCDNQDLTVSLQTVSLKPLLRVFVLFIFSPLLASPSVVLVYTPSLA